MAKKLNTTPRGVAVYPHLNSPDTKFKPEGEWRVKLTIEGAEGKGIVSQ